MFEMESRIRSSDIILARFGWRRKGSYTKGFNYYMSKPVSCGQKRHVLCSDFENVLAPDLCQRSNEYGDIPRFERSNSEIGSQYRNL